MKAIQIGILSALVVMAGLLYLNLKRDGVTAAQTSATPVAPAAAPVLEPSSTPEPAEAGALLEQVSEAPVARPTPARVAADPAPVRAARTAVTPGPTTVPAPRPAPVQTSPPVREVPTAPARTEAPEPVAEQHTPPEPEFRPMRPETPLRPTPAAAPPARTPKTVTLPAGTMIAVRLAETLDSAKMNPGDTFVAFVDSPVIVDGLVIADRRSRVEGKVVTAKEAGRVRGTADLEIELTKLDTDDGQTIGIQTVTFRKEGEKSLKQDATKVGVASGIGAAIGAIAGGGKGAGIGAAVGGAAGAGGVMATRGKPAVLATETRITFSLSAPVTITEKLN
jgi:hypothetical protein